MIFHGYVSLPEGHQRRLVSYHVGVSKNGGTQQPWVFLLKMIILGVLGVPPFTETSMSSKNSTETKHEVQS